MPSSKDNAILKTKQLIGLLKSNGIDVSEAYLFGSAALNESREYSDIDIAIVSDKFTGVPFFDRRKISKFRRAVDLRLEVHPFSLDDILDDPPLFFVDIKSKGIPIVL